MKLYLIILIMLFVATYSYSQIIDEPMIIKSKRINNIYKKHNVKKVTWYKFSIDSNGEKSEKGELTNIDEYNKQGLGIKETSFMNGEKYSTIWEYDKDGNNLRDIKTISNIKNEYNHNGKLLKSKYFDKTNGKLLQIDEFDTIKLRRISTEYNKEGDIVQKTVTLYDSINKIYTSRFLSSNGDIEYENLYYLNDSLKIIKWCVTNNSLNEKFIETYKYDNHGNEIEIVVVDPNGKPKEKVLLKYNNFDCLVECIVYKPIDKIHHYKTIEYEYFK